MLQLHGKIANENDENKFSLHSSRQGRSEGQQQVRDLKDLRSKTDAQLLELLQRQRHILLQKSLMAKLADGGEKIKGLVNRIEEELKSREDLKSAGAQRVVADFGERIEWNIGDEEVKPALPEKSSDPLLNFLKQQKTNIKIMDPYAEQICSKFGSPKENASVTERFMPHRSSEASRRLSPSSGSVQNHSTQEIPIRDSLLLQKKQINTESKLLKANTQLASWRQLAAVIDSDESDAEDEEQSDEEVDPETKTEEEDVPELPDLDDATISER
ncbi:Hypothetical predicted protein [Cloeon dipterum]|uniref:Uncharacterized protein n=1 Tax=Cloeon dipterum TaxID=197152 RepID=A0A8S1DNW8_9INSE|nr:Hypothetical predicted protein [Cloeon dipterum]